MADNEVSLESAFEETPQEEGIDPDIESLPGYREETAPSLSQALGEEAPQDEFSAYEAELRYRSPFQKAMGALGYLESKAAEAVLPAVPAIKDAAIDIADTMGIDTSQWSPVDQEKWKTYLKAPEVHFHDLTNLMIDKDHAKSRFLLGLASDILLDPTFYVGNVLGPSAKGAKALQTLQEGQRVGKLSQRLRTGEAVLGEFGLGKYKVNIPGSRLAANALDAAEDIGSGVLDMADEFTSGQARRALYNTLTRTNAPLVGEKINKFNAQNIADDINISSFNDRYRKLISELSDEQKVALGEYLEKPYDIITDPRLTELEGVQRGKGLLDVFETKQAKRLGQEAISPGKFVPLKTDISIKKFPLDEKYREVVDALRGELRDRNMELATHVGAIDKTGRPTIGWSAIKEAIGDEDILTRPQSYFPRQVHPELKKFLKENGLTDQEITDTVPIFSDASRRQRTYRNVTAKEASEIETKRINSLLEERGAQARYGGKIYESDPLNAVVRYNAMAKQQLNRMKLEDELRGLSISKQEWDALPQAEKVKWQQFDAGSKVAESSNPFVIGKKLHGRLFLQGDADRARLALQLKPSTALDQATYAVSFLTRFFRQATLLSPKYFGGNAVGNLMNSYVVAPNRATLLNDWGDAFGVIRAFANRSDKVFNVAGELKTADKIIEEAASLGLWDSSRAREFYENIKGVGETVADTIQASKRLYSQTGKLPPAWNIFKFNQEFTNLYADNLGKLGLYFNLRKAGYSKQGAANIVQEALFNFQDVSPALAQARRVLPFITFPTKMVPFTAKTVAKYPWLPALVDRTVKNANSQNMDLSPIEQNIVRDIAPIYYRTFFNPLIANVLPGNNLLVSDLQSPMSTINSLMNIRAPGVTPALLMAFGVNPDTLDRIQTTDFQQSLNDDGPSAIGTIGKSLVTDPIPKPIKALLSLVTGDFVSNPYAAKIKDRMSKYRALTDISDEEFGKYMTTQSFMKKFMPDAFEEVVVKSNPDLYRAIGSVARQHLKDVFFGLAQVTPLDGEMNIRRIVIDKEIINTRKKLQGVYMDVDKSQDPTYRADEISDLQADLETLSKAKENLGTQYDMIFNLEKKFRSKVQEDFNPDEQ